MPPGENPTLPDWPLLFDVDGDGSNEVVVPDSGPLPPGQAYRGVRMLDGASGKSRWVRPMRLDTKAHDRLCHIVVAPDLDGDGARDLVIVSRCDGRRPGFPSRFEPVEPERIFVDALSGQDGHPLWWWYADVPEEQSTRVWPPVWWGRGPDGWPLLAITLGGSYEVNFGIYANRPAIAQVLEASTGREVHTVDGLTRTQVADFDGDGLGDLWGEAGRQLAAVRGQSPEVWRALGRFSRAGRLDWRADSARTRR